MSYFEDTEALDGCGCHVHRQILWSFQKPEASPLKKLRLSPNEMDRN